MHRRLVKTGVVVHIPPDILRTPTVAQSLVRNKISSTAISAVMHEIITAAQGDSSKLSLSYSSTERYKLEAIENLSEKISNDWTSPAVANIHWDGKLMDTLEGTQKVERLPILLSGIGGTKLLGVPAIPHKTAAVGSKIAKATLELVKIWDCEKVYVVCEKVYLQNVVSKPLLWFACRHYIGEIILTHVWDALHIEVSKSPEISIFQRFWQYYPTVSTVCESFDFHEIPQTLQSRRENTIQMCNAYLEQPFS